MRGFKRSPWLTGLGVLLTILAVSAGQARADASIDKKGSVLVFPKVVVSSTQDTLIQITNTINSRMDVHCIYVTRSSCQEENFTIELTAQQPTFWRVSTGRGDGEWTVPPCKLNDPTCSCSVGPGGVGLFCPGFDTKTGPSAPNPLPQQPTFDGALWCYEVDGSDEGEPVIIRNSLKGEAIVEDLTSGDIAAYNAIAINGIETAAGGTIDLNNANWNACPDRLVLNHYTEGYPEPAFELPAANTSVSTELSLVPCTVNFNQNPISASARVNWFVTNEYEQQLSGGFDTGCVFRASLSQINPTSFSYPVLATATAATSLNGTPRTGGGVLGSAQETHTLLVGADTKKVSAAFNLFAVEIPDFERSDTITPWEFIR